jgi:hypothetical protein
MIDSIMDRQAVPPVQETDSSALETSVNQFLDENAPNILRDLERTYRDLLPSDNGNFCWEICEVSSVAFVIILSSIFEDIRRAETVNLIYSIEQDSVITGFPHVGLVLELSNNRVVYIDPTYRLQFENQETPSRQSIIYFSSDKDNLYQVLEEKYALFKATYMRNDPLREHLNSVETATFPIAIINGLVHVTSTAVLEPIIEKYAPDWQDKFGIRTAREELLSRISKQLRKPRISQGLLEIIQQSIEQGNLGVLSSIQYAQTHMGLQLPDKLEQQLQPYYTQFLTRNDNPI